MDTNDIGRAEARSRAARRLRTMTIGTAMLGIAATGTLGWAAAATFTGSATGSTIPASVDDTSSGISTSSGTSTSSTPTTTTTSQGQVSAPSVVGSAGGAHVSTGGS